MTWYPLDTWIVVIGAMGAVSCSLVGSFLVVRGLSLMGDAISHAVLPGLALGYLVSGERTSVLLFVAAMGIGVLTAFLTQGISQLGKVDRGASMGIVFTTLFALGLLLMVGGADTVDLDPGCVLYGTLELAPLDTVAVVGWQIPRTVLTIGGSLLVNLLAIVLLFKEWRISSFDPELSRALGYSPSLLHYLLMLLVAVTTVAVFEAVGSILVIAMLIVPAACASLVTRRLGSLLAVAAGFALLSAFLGHVGALTVPQWLGFSGTSTSGMMAVAAGLLFGVVALGTVLRERLWTCRGRGEEQVAEP